MSKIVLRVLIKQKHVNLTTTWKKKNRWIVKSKKENNSQKQSKLKETVAKQKQNKHEKWRGQLTLQSGKCHPKLLRQTDIWRHNSRIMTQGRGTHSQYTTTDHSRERPHDGRGGGRRNFSIDRLLPFYWLDVQQDFKAFNIWNQRGGWTFSF